MANEIFRYGLDPTGQNQDNLVQGEPHVLEDTPVRALCPNYGPFFKDSVFLYDVDNAKPLDKTSDYVCVEILQDATNKFGLEISSLILITNDKISKNVQVTYQVLGGLYQNDSSALVNIYDTYLKDDRPVDWADVLNKPTTFTPTFHRHLISDVYGTEPLVVSLERIRNAIVLGDVPAFEALIQWVKNNCMVAPYVNLGEGSGGNVEIVTEQDIINETVTDRVVSFERLLFALKHLNFNSVIIEPERYTVQDVDTINVAITTSNTPNNTVLYWKVAHVSTDDNDFSTLSGVVNINGNRGQFSLSTSRYDKKAEPLEQFKIEVRRETADGPLLTTSGLISISAHGALSTEYPVRYYTEPSFMMPSFEHSATSLYIAETIRPVPVRRRIGGRILNTLP